MKLDQIYLDQGQAQHEATINDPGRGPRDPVITPFVYGMVHAGYQTVTNGRCMVLRGCPFCPVGKSNYSALYEKAGARFWACPHCREISPAPAAS